MTEWVIRLLWTLADGWKKGSVRLKEVWVNNEQGEKNLKLQWGNKREVITWLGSAVLKKRKQGKVNDDFVGFLLACYNKEEN